MKNEKYIPLNEDDDTDSNYSDNDLFKIKRREKLESKKKLLDVTLLKIISEDIEKKIDREDDKNNNNNNYYNYKNDKDKDNNYKGKFCDDDYDSEITFDLNSNDNNNIDNDYNMEKNININNKKKISNKFEFNNDNENDNNNFKINKSKVGKRSNINLIDKKKYINIKGITFIENNNNYNNNKSPIKYNNNNNNSKENKNNLNKKSSKKLSIRNLMLFKKMTSEKLKQMFEIKKKKIDENDQKQINIKSENKADQILNMSLLGYNEMNEDDKCVNMENLKRVIRLRNIINGNFNDHTKRDVLIMRKDNYEEEMEKVMRFRKIGPPAFLKTNFKKDTELKFKMLGGKFFGCQV
jgi:hypothetical protein